MMKLTEGYHPAYMQGHNDCLVKSEAKIARLRGALTKIAQPVRTLGYYDCQMIAEAALEPVKEGIDDTRR